jgi:ferredoxin--NADP+ reductase
MRIAIVGAGPTGFFLAKSLLDQAGENWRVDIFEKTPFPYGLVRFGVAPDHPKIKSVTKGFDKTLEDPRCHFWGGVTIGEKGSEQGPTVQELLRHYDRVALTVGCQDDRKLGIPFEEASNSFSATRFVGWYNAHPEDLELNPNLGVRRAAVVGAGNVAIDIVRILISPPGRLASTDISDRALAALEHSTIKEVDVLVRRGAWDVAFTNPEVKELLDFQDVAFTFDPPLAQFEDVPAYADRRATTNMEVFRQLEQRQVENPRCKVHFRFLVSPKELRVDDEGRVAGVELGHNQLCSDQNGSWVKETPRSSTLPSELFLRSVGYRGRPLAGVGYCTRRGVIPADPQGRVLDEDGQPVPGLYVSGWMRRGPSGVIGTNKKDASEVAEAILADSRAGFVPSPEPEFESWLRQTVAPSAVSKTDWAYLDQREVVLGQPQGRPRRKFLSAAEVAQELTARQANV